MKTTIVSILFLTALFVCFGIKKPSPVAMVEQPTTTEAQTMPRLPGKSEFSQLTTIVPMAEAAAAPKANVETETPVESLSREALKSEIETLQQYVVRENAISRLNEGSVSAEERVIWGKTFERLLALCSRSLRLSLENAQASLESYKAQHEARVAQYVGGKS